MTICLKHQNAVTFGLQFLLMIDSTGVCLQKCAALLKKDSVAFGLFEPFRKHTPDQYALVTSCFLTVNENKNSRTDSMKEPYMIKIQ